MVVKCSAGVYTFGSRVIVFDACYRKEDLRIARFYCQEFEEGTVELCSDEAHHLIHVMRLGAGAEVEVFDGKGSVGKAIVKEVGRASVKLEVEKVERFTPHEKRIVIAASIPKGQRFDEIVGKCTELGVDGIAAVLFERTVKQAANPAAVERWKKVSISAAKQCGRNFLPKIIGPAGLEEVIGELKKDYPDVELIYGDFGEGTKSVFSLDRVDKHTAAFVGPEGGFTDKEIEVLKAVGAAGVKISDTVLRVETAATAFAAILCGKRSERV